jgi:RiboL-PSP-HEPN
MRAYDLAIQNFSVAEHLLQLHELFRDLREEKVNEPLRLAVCKCLSLPEESVLRHARNEQMLMVAKATAPIPHSLLVADGINLLLRQAVVVACTALESFFWDALRENVITIVRARRRRAEESLRSITLTLDDYLSIEGYQDPDVRLQQIILKNFERGTLYDAASIERISGILTVKDFWKQVAKKCGLPDGDIKRQIGELITRRNQVAHRADRPDENANPVEEQDGLGLRAISFAWANTRVSTAKNVVSASAEIFDTTLKQLETQLAQEEEQKLAQQTLRHAGAPSSEAFGQSRVTQ